jgi:hypothetical protein
VATKAQRAAADKWDKEHGMVYQSVKIRRELRDNFKAACAANGQKVNTVLREAMQRYVEEAAAGATVDTSTNAGTVAIIPCEISSAIWHSPTDTGHRVYYALHDNPALAKSYRLAFDYIMQAVTDSEWATRIDTLIQRVQVRIDADGEKRPK